MKRPSLSVMTIFYCLKSSKTYNNRIANNTRFKLWLHAIYYQHQQLKRQDDQRQVPLLLLVLLLIVLVRAKVVYTIKKLYQIKICSRRVILKYKGANNFIFQSGFLLYVARTILTGTPTIRWHKSSFVLLAMTECV